MEKSEQEKFLSDLEVENQKDPFEKPLTEEVSPEKEETPENTELRAKNRRERRLIEQNQRLREEAIAASARAQALSETTKFQEEVGNDHLKEVESIFGTDTPEKLAATNILKKALSGMSESAVQKAIDKIEERRASESTAIQQEEKTLETMLEDVEDDYGIDMSNESERKAFLVMLEKASPKDGDGNIIEYADRDYVAEQFIEKRKAGNSNGRAKELASRSMTRSGTSQSSNLQDDATIRLLKREGII